VAWNSLRHPNVMSLLGATMDGDGFAMVSEWMTNGNIKEFVKAHWEVNRFELVGPGFSRFPLSLTTQPDSSKASPGG
jgi:serine/threonine protein kinase